MRVNDLCLNLFILKTILKGPVCKIWLHFYPLNNFLLLSDSPIIPQSCAEVTLRTPSLLPSTYPAV